MKILSFLLTSYLLLLSSFSSAQITFQKTFGGPALENNATVQNTADGGYIVISTTESFGAGGRDIYLVKTDIYGDTLWTKTIGGPSIIDEGLSVKQTTDGGYIIIGLQNFIKTDANGDTLWTKTFGPLYDVYGRFVQQTTDGGYLISGSFYNSGSFDSDALLARTDANGDILWIKGYGGNDDEEGMAQQTSDGGYIISGIDLSALHENIYLIKTDVNGDTLWTKSYGGANDDWGVSILQTTDGGYIIAGSTESFGAGSADVYLIKTDSSGNLMWTKTFGGPSYDDGQSVQQTTDGGYIIIGNTVSFGAGNTDVYLIRTDANGDTLWTKTFGGSSVDPVISVQQTSDGSFIIGATTTSFGVASPDIYLIRTDSIGNSGCQQGNTATIVTSPATIVKAYPTIVSQGSFAILSPSLIVGNGGLITTFCSFVGIYSETFNSQSEISISPNPSPGNFIITFPYAINKAEIQIFNAYGSKVFFQSINHTSNTEIHLKNIPGGIYFVKVFAGEKYLNNKIIIQQN